MISEQTSSATISTQPTQTDSSQNPLVTTFQCDPQDILDTFEEIAKQLGFDLIQRQASFATAIKKLQKKNKFFDLINCLSWWPHNNLTAMKISLSKHTRKGQIKQIFIVQLKGLVGMPQLIKQFIQNFIILSRRQGLVTTGSKVIIEQEKQSQIDINQTQNPFYLQACTHHIVNKLILSKQYQINSSMQKMISDYLGNFKNIEQSVSLLPLPMKNIISIITDLHSQLQIILTNLKYPKQIFTFCRSSVQIYIFNKLQKQVYSIYRLKNIDIQISFQKKKQRILQSYTLKQILQQVCLNPKFWSVKPQFLNSVLSVKEGVFTYLLRNKMSCFVTLHVNFKKQYLPVALDKKQNTVNWDTLKSKIIFLILVCGKLSSMQDIIPVLIVIVLFLQIGQLRSQLDLMLDFINFDPQEMEAEKRLLINLSQSYNYIQRDWNLKN